MNDDEIKEIIKNYAIEVRMDQGEANLTGVLKHFLTEHPEMKTEIRKKLGLVKEVIQQVNSMEQDDFAELSDIDPDELGDETSEYEMLVSLFKKKLLEDEDLKDNIQSLIIYGSYAKKLHIVGESDINFVLTLKKDSDSENLINKINVIAESIITPELSHIFDLMILKEEDFDNLESFGEVFTYIHALYARDGEVIIGENSFKDRPEITEDKLKESAKILILDAVQRMDEVVSTAKEEGLPNEEIEYLLGSIVIDLAFSLCCYRLGFKASKEDLVKPDIHEEFIEIFKGEKEFEDFYPLLQQAHAYKLSIRLDGTKNFIENSYSFAHKVLEYTGLINKNDKS